MKPAPPVTNTIPESGIDLLSSYSDILKTHFAHIRRLVNVAQIGNPRNPHQFPNTLHIQSAELIPFRHKNDYVRASGGGVLIMGVFDFGQDLSRFVSGNGIVSD